LLVGKAATCLIIYLLEYKNDYRNMIRREEREPVEALNDNDVLLGRGTGPSQYVGNKRFRRIVNEYREEYVACSKHKEKNMIAKRVYDSVISAGGRFLCLSEDAEPVDVVVENGIWYVETNVKVCMEKCRQALRQKKKPPKPTSQAPDTTRNANQDSANTAPPQPSMFASLSVPQRPVTHVSSLPAPDLGLVPAVMPSALETGVVPPPAMLDARLLLYQTDLHMQAQLQQNQRMQDARQPILSSFVSNPTGASFQHQQQAQHPIAQGPSESEANKKHGLHQQPVAVSRHLDDSASSEVDSTTIEPHGDDTPAEQEEVSEYLLSVLALSGRSKFTDEQVEAEKANMSDQEKAKVLCDLFGKYCSVQHQDKRAKRDLGTKDIAFLVKQMRVEIDKIPSAEKETLMEAQQKCNRPEEFSDGRLEQFLRCEGMDVKVRCLVRFDQEPQCFVSYQSHVVCTHTRIPLTDDASHHRVSAHTAGSSTILQLLGCSSICLQGKVSAAHDFERGVTR
jgi:hypothetical protein